MDQEAQIVVIKNTPRPFREIPLLWLKFWKMDADFFRNEISHTGGKNIIFGILLYAAITTLLSVVFTSAKNLIGTSQNDTNLGVFIQTDLINGLIIRPISFFTSNLIFFITALLFKGKGKLNTQIYLNSLIVPPIGIVFTLSSFLSLIPLTGNFVWYLFCFAIAIWSFVLQIQAFRVAHNISVRRTIFIFITIIIVSTLFITLFMISLRPRIGEIQYNVIETIISPTP